MEFREAEPKPRVEELALDKLGYAHCLDVPLGEGTDIVGRNFLDMYSDPENRQHTEDTLVGLLETPTTDPEYPAMKAHVLRYLVPYFGPPQPVKPAG